MRKKIDLLLLLLVLVGGFFAVRNAQAIGDWWHATRYTPPPEIQQLAEDAGMNDTGRKLFYRFSPELVSQAELDRHCDKGRLGCAEGQDIYILESTTDAEYNRNVVTAAHEMLHVAYSRLSQEQRGALDPQLEAALKAYGLNNIASKLQDYPSDAYINEAHSFIGSETRDPGNRLEQHYKQYFADRSKTVGAFEASGAR